MAEIDKDIEVNVPLQTVYNQWTQFEEFPHFMEGVKSVTQVSDDRLLWVAEVGGIRKEWGARITEQLPDQEISWLAEAGTWTAGRVAFEPVGPENTRIKLHLEYEPENIAESAADALGFISRRVEGDLKRFKEFIESRRTETGAWRGEIDSKNDMEHRRAS